MCMTDDVLSTWTDADQFIVDNNETEKASIDTRFDDINTEIGELKNSVSDGKSSIASAITNQGVTTASDATFATMSTNIGTVASNKYNEGYSAGYEESSTIIPVSAGYFITTGSEIMYSADAMRIMKSSAISCNAIANSEKELVTVGDNGVSYYSINGKTWTAMSGLDTSKNYGEVTYTNGKYVTVSTDGVSYLSTDGRTWDNASSFGRDSGTVGYSLDSYTYRNNIGTYFACVGYYGDSYYSRDGISWTALSGLGTSHQYLRGSMSMPKSQEIVGLYMICIDNYGNTYTYDDSWTFKSTASGYNFRIDYYITGTKGSLVNRAVCVGEIGKSYYSSDAGTTWTALSGLITSTDYYERVNYIRVRNDNGFFVCIGTRGYIHCMPSFGAWSTGTRLYKDLQNFTVVHFDN